MMTPQFTLTDHCLFRNNTPIRLRTADQSLRDFLMALLDEFYTGEDYRFTVVDDLGLACLASTAVCLSFHPQWTEIMPQQRALVFATRSGSLLTDQEYQRSLEKGGRTSPRTFVQTLPNMAAGQVAACYAIRGEHFVIIQSDSKAVALEETVAMCLEFGGAKVCLAAWVEHTLEAINVSLKLHYAGEEDQEAMLPELMVRARS